MLDGVILFRFTFFDEIAADTYDDAADDDACSPVSANTSADTNGNAGANNSDAAGGDDDELVEPLTGVAVAKQFVSVTPGAISYIRASDADDSVKVVKVDGHAPGEAGYALKL